VARLRAAGDLAVGEALLDQRLVSGIGNLWRAEALWEAQVSPWARLPAISDERLEAVLTEARRLMKASVEGARPARRVYRRVGRPCPRCGAAIRSYPQGDHARIAYWCPGCQEGAAGEP
jgi:endonuclease-8